MEGQQVFDHETKGRIQTYAYIFLQQELGAEKSRKSCLCNLVRPCSYTFGAQTNGFPVEFFLSFIAASI